MGLFSKQKAQSFVGIDLGVSGIKVVQLLNEQGRARLATYAFADYPASSNDRTYVQQVDKAAALLKKIVGQGRVTTKTAVAALPISAVFSSIISVPARNEKELQEAIQWQAKKLIPLPLEEIALDAKPLDPPPKEAEEKKRKGGKGAADDVNGKKNVQRVLLTGAPTTLVNAYVKILAGAGLEPLALETEAFAQIRALVGHDRSTVMVLDVGAFRTSLTVVEKGVPFLSRSIATGGVAITQNIAKTLGIPFEQAEAMKKDIKSLKGFAPTGDLTPMLQSLLKPILDEIKYSFNLYQSQSATSGEAKKIEKIILTGGSSLLPRFPEFLTELMNVNSYVGDPWARVVYPEDLRPVLEEIGPRFSVAIGCAMRDIES